MKQVQIKTGKVEMLVVDLPKSATGIHTEPDLICFDFKEDDITYPDYIIANGEWQYLGKATELTEEDWKGIVDEAFTTGLGQYTKPSDLDGWKVVDSPMGVRYEKVTHVSFKDYTIPTEGFSIAAQHPFQTSTESGLSLLRANGVVLENPYGKDEPIVDDPDPSSQYYGSQMDCALEWNFWESKVWRNCHVFKLK